MYAYGIKTRQIICVHLNLRIKCNKTCDARYDDVTYPFMSVLLVGSSAPDIQPRASTERTGELFIVCTIVYCYMA